MRKDCLDINLQSLKFQRNVFSALTFTLALGIVPLSLFLFLKNERIVISPPVVEKEFWVEGKSISPTYLEQFGCFLGQLLLSKTAQSAPTQRTILLRHTDPGFAPALKNKLTQEEQVLKVQNASYVFYPIEIKVNAAKKEALLIGERLSFASGIQVSQEREEYLLSFSYINSRLLLNGISSNDSKGKCRE